MGDQCWVSEQNVNITNHTEGQKYTNRHMLWQNWTFLPGFTRKRICFTKNSHIMFDLCCVIVFILSMPCFEMCKKKKIPEYTEDLYFLLTVLTPTCLQHQLSIPFCFTFSHTVWFQTKSFQLSLNSPYLWKCHTPTLSLLSLFHLPWKITLLSSTIFAHAYSSCLHLIKCIRQFYTPFVFPSGSTYSRCFQRRLHMLKNPDTITAPVILKNERGSEILSVAIFLC